MFKKGNSKMLFQANSLVQEKPTTSYKFFWVILALAFCFRLYFVINYPGIIENDGADYASIAAHLLKGDGYFGITAGPQLIFPPLYPLLIASFSFITQDIELAARLVSLVMGTCLVIPMFFIALYLYGRRVAYIAASLIAFYPLLISLSASAYCESTYLTLMMSGIYFGLRSLKGKTLKPYIATGLCFGLAYLTRPEAFVYPFLTILVISIFAINKGNLRKAIIGSLSLLLPFILLAAPYIAFLSSYTGHLSLEGKSILHYIDTQRMNSGMSFDEALYGINQNLEEEGPLLNQNFIVSHSGSIPVQDLPKYFITNIGHHILPLLRILIKSTALGSPVLILLALVGVFCKTSRPLFYKIYLLLILSFIFFVLLVAERTSLRYTLPLLPFIILWAAKGIDQLSLLTQNVITPLQIQLTAKQFRSFVACFLSVILLLVAVRGEIAGEAYETADMFEQALSWYLPIKTAGLWLKQYRPGPKKIMTVMTALPYYAEGTLEPFPYAEESLALSYIHHKNPDFIILDGHSRVDSRPYLRGWIKEGFPDKSAKLIYSTGDKPEERILIYQWNGVSLKQGLPIPGAIAFLLDYQLK